MGIKLPASITVDFSNSDDDGLIFARTARANRALEPGEMVLASDGEEHVCDARVVRIEGEVVYLQLDWDTWTTIEYTRSTTGGFRKQLVPNYVSNGGASVESESGPVTVTT